MRDTRPDYYKTLQVDSSADQEVIEAAYRRLVRKYHPDINPDRRAHETIQAINEAYSVIGNPTKRKHYDEQLHSPVQSSLDPSPTSLSDPVILPEMTALNFSHDNRY